MREEVNANKYTSFKKNIRFLLFLADIYILYSLISQFSLNLRDQRSVSGVLNIQCRPTF